MKTYQDLQAVGENIKDRMEFVQTVIREHKASGDYNWADICSDYYKGKNRTIKEFTKFIYDNYGNKIQDIWSANYKMPTKIYKRFVVQLVQYLLGNGVKWKNYEYREIKKIDENGNVKIEMERYSPTAEKLGNRQYPFDIQLNKSGKEAQKSGVSFNFLNLDHIEIFKLTEFAPLFDEENGSLRSGIRFWQIDSTKPLRATLYEEDGYTEMMFYTPKDTFIPSKEWQIIDNGVGWAIKDKKAYIVKSTGDSKDRMDNTEIMEGKNYPKFPIVPLWANSEHLAMLDGLREKIDCYDLCLSGLANSVDEASSLYWIFSGAYGMDEPELKEAIEKINTLKALNLPQDVTAQVNTVNIPTQANEVLLERLEKNLYRDAMAVDYEKIASGSVVTAQIEAAFKDLDAEADDFETCILEFIYSLLELLGIDDEATFDRANLINKSEMIQNLMMLNGTMPTSYIIEKAATVLGDKDLANSLIAEAQREELGRYTDEDGTTE